MLKPLIQKELLNNLYNQRYVMTLLLLVVLIGVSIWSLEKTHRTMLAHHAEATVGYRDEALSSRLAWQWMASGVTREKKPGDLALVAKGLDTDMTRSLSFAGWNPVEVGAAQLISPLFRLFRTPDYVYLINIIGSLLALLFVYDAVCGEKEEGTLRLMLTSPVPRDHILLAKWLAGLLSLCVPLALASLGAAAYLYVAPSFEATAEQLVRLFLIFVVSLLYLSTFFTLGLLVSCMTRTAGTALMVCLFLWILLVLALPNMMPMIARGLRPVPAPGKLAIEKSHKSREVWEWAEGALRSKIHDPSEYHDTVRRLVAREMEGLDRFRRNRIQEQVQVAQNLARISPSSCYLFAAYDLAKTGVGSFRRFQRYTYLYREQFNQQKDRLQESFRQRARESGTGWWGMQEFTADDMNSMPRFRPLEITLGQSIRDVLFDVAALLTFNVVFFLASYVAFLRYDAK